MEYVVDEDYDFTVDDENSNDTDAEENEENSEEY